MDGTAADRRQWVLAAVADHEAALRRYAARMLRDEHAAADAVQHVFLQLCRQTPERIGGRLAPWLFQVCRNKVLDMLRRRQRMEPLAEAACPAVTADPAAAAEEADLTQQLEAMLRCLPDGQREALALWSEGLPYQQIAAVTGQSEGNVRVMVHRAFKRLRENRVVRELLGWEVKTI